MIPLHVGQSFGHLVISGPPERTFREYPSGRKCLRMWAARCVCGTEIRVGAGPLTRGRVTSCGCRTTHGDGSNRQGKRVPEYTTWWGMRNRCDSKRSPAYEQYGGRGITVCDRWRESYETFLADMGRKPSPNHSIDRIDTNGNYEPGNCRWATRIEQARNKRTTAMLTHLGRTLPLIEWAGVFGIHPDTVRGRLKKYGWTVEAALSTPPKRRPGGGLLPESGRCRSCDPKR